MQKQDHKGEQPGCSAAVHGQMNNVTVWDLAKELHLGRNTVANIAKELSIQFKYENWNGKVRAYVYGDEADEIRQVFNERFSNHWE